MRNGNWILQMIINVVIYSSYRTYEEWKQTYHTYENTSEQKSSYRTYEEWKLHITSQNTVNLRLFLPYLWGMETLLNRPNNYICSSSYRTYEEWKLSSTARPFWTSVRSYRTYEEWKRPAYRFSLSVTFRFLPYLWGMETIDTTDINALETKFLPYLWGMETAIPCNATQVLESSYRTYEEWKPSNRRGVCAWRRTCSYRTYEEWKLETSNTLRVSVKVLTVPMRNGNAPNGKIYAIPRYAFLPYLWGMETRHR